MLLNPEFVRSCLIGAYFFESYIYLPPQYKISLQGIELHFLHIAGNGRNPHPLLLSHDWPGSVFEFLELIPRLTDPRRFGADPADAFTVIVPSLPGYGLSFTSGQARFGIEAIADFFAELMTDVLGYGRFGAQGGDWGSRITARLGLAYPERMSMEQPEALAEEIRELFRPLRSTAISSKR